MLTFMQKEPQPRIKWIYSAVYVCTIQLTDISALQIILFMVLYNINIF